MDQNSLTHELARAALLISFSVAMAGLVACSDDVGAEVDAEDVAVSTTPDSDVDAPEPDVPAGSDVPDVVASDVSAPDQDVVLDSLPMNVMVTIDGEPAADTLVVQGGNPAHWMTGPDGTVTIEVDLLVPGDYFVMASHPEARIAGQSVHFNDPFFEDTADVSIALVRFDTTDNEAYIFKDPGEPGNSHVIEKCAHCHLTVADSWGNSAHRTAAKNPLLHDVYEGTALGTDSEEACTARSGTWVEDVHPSTGEPRFRCKVTDGVLDHGTTGACADCHAPGIDGVVGGRDLRDAKGRSYEEGAHCDVCHHVESVHLDAGPGVSGSLKILRPSEEAPFPGVGEWHPLTFCPSPDNGNKLMSCVQRDHFRQSEFCAGCHEHQQAVLVTDGALDAARWPSGTLPIQTTFSEWMDSALAGAVTCQGCHMPAAPPEVSNGADLQAFSGNNTGITGGWPRPHGSVRLHSWSGPRSPDDVKLSNPLSVQIETEVVADSFTASVTVTNSGAGHAIPTGEPLRSVVLLVSATCDGTPLAANGGDAIPDFGGAYDRKVDGDDWTVWPGAEVGQVIRVVSRTDGHHDYTGYGPFGDGTFDAAAKGMPIEHVVGETTIATVDGDVITVDPPMPSGNVAYRVDASAHAGASGFAFAKVLVGADGERMVHHYEAVDVASDNRLLPSGTWISTHAFPATCDAPTVTAEVIQRGVPVRLAAERGWALRDLSMVTVVSPASD